MSFLGKWRAWADLQLGQKMFHCPSQHLEYLQSYFLQRCDVESHPDPFYHGLNVFAAGYCFIRQIVEKPAQLFSIDGNAETFEEKDFQDSLEWMRLGILEMSSSDVKTRPKEAVFYCFALDEFSAFLDRIGEYEMALLCNEQRLDFGKEYAAQITCGELLEKQNFIHALYLAHAGRYDEAIQEYPGKDILHAILETNQKCMSEKFNIDMLPYVQAVIDNVHDPNGRCSEEDLEYAHCWLADFYLYTGSYAEVIAIGLEDIIENKIGMKRNLNAVHAYQTFAVSANKIGLSEFAKNAISTAYELAKSVFDCHVDSDVLLFYQLCMDCFEIYFSQSDLEKAELFLNRAQKLLDDRSECLKQNGEENEADAAMNMEFIEHIMQCKAVLFHSQGRQPEALELSERLVCLHNRRRQENSDSDANVIDKFYIEALSINIICMLCVAHERSILSDERIKEMIQAMLYVAEELKVITLDDMRADFICSLQDWSNVILSYWTEFQDHTISDELLYKFELNTKNIDLDIRHMHNLALQGDDNSIEKDAVNLERRELWSNYQKEIFEGGNLVKANQDFKEKQMSFDIKRFQVVKESGYEFPCYEPAWLQERLGKNHALLEFRKFQRQPFFPDTATVIDSEYWYGAFLITGDSIVFRPLSHAQEIEKAVSMLLADIQDVDMIDRETISDKVLSHVEEVLFSPFRGCFDGIGKLYIVPDDELYKVPFELMRVFDGEHTIKEDTGMEICYLTSARSLMKNYEEHDSYQSIRIIANPEFKIENEPGIEPEDRRDSVTEDALEAVRDALLRSGLSALKYSNLEAETIKNTFSEYHMDAELLIGRDARKSNVFTTPTDIIHFATHGFAVLKQWNEEDGKGQADDCINPERIRRIAASNNPLMRCGLCLSGADNWIHGTEVNGFGNGILTGVDIMSENLAGYRLAVLSACCTGQGTVAYSGEGIEGLRSAFELAGIPTLLCTLWEVDDFATALFMTKFYRELQSGSTPLSALYMAKRTLRDMTYMDLELGGFREKADSLYEERMALSKDEKPFVHPRYWAGFILHGVSAE